MPVNRGRVTTAPALVEGVIEATNAKRNESIVALQAKMEVTSQWLDNAIASAKRKITEGTEVAINDFKKAKITEFAKDMSFEQKERNQSSVRHGKENSPNVNREEIDEHEEHVGIKPPPSAVKRKVNGMRVVDLRKELKHKGKETKGLKKDLQQRLLQAYTTVEKIMSPQRSPESRSEEKEGPPTEKAEEDNIPDSESVEMIVFESTESNSNEEAKNRTNGKVDLQENKSEEITRPLWEKGKSKVGSDDTEMAESSPKKAPQQSSSNENDYAMEVDDNPGRKAPSSAKRIETRSNDERLSTMDCSIVEEGPSLTSEHTCPFHENQNIKEIGSFGAEESTNPSIELTGSKESRDQKQSTEMDQKQSTEMGQKDGQESLSKACLKSDCITDAGCSPKTTEGIVSEYRVEKESILAGASEGTIHARTSPLKRVQAAIQMLTAKSPSKPNPATLPSNLAWLKNSKFQKIKSNFSAEQKIENSEGEKQETNQVKAEVMTTGTAMRRPGTGLYSNKGTSSALKSSSKYHLGPGQPSSTLSASAKATNEARKARLAEIRGKSKPVSKPVTYVERNDPAAKESSTSSSSKSTSSLSSESKESKRKLLTEQMRAKAAARKLEQQATTGVSMTKAAPSSTKSVEEAKAPAQAPGFNADQRSKNEFHEAQVLSDCSVIKKVSDETPDKPSKVVDGNTSRQPMLSPLDTYEISDREGSESGSESESESEDERKSRKKVPDWAQRANLLPALEKQFSQGSDCFDPDEIFPEVQTCDLQAIFSSKRTRYVRRTSSANWSRDKVTPVEQLAYKRAMGFSPNKK